MLRTDCTLTFHYNRVLDFILLLLLLCFLLLLPLPHLPPPLLLLLLEGSDLVLFLCFWLTGEILKKVCMLFPPPIFIIGLSTLDYQSQNIIIQTDFSPSGQLSNGACGCPKAQGDFCISLSKAQESTRACCTLFLSSSNKVNCKNKWCSETSRKSKSWLWKPF